MGTAILVCVFSQKHILQFKIASTGHNACPLRSGIVGDGHIQRKPGCIILSGGNPPAYLGSIIVADGVIDQIHTGLVIVVKTSTRLGCVVVGNG